MSCMLWHIPSHSSGQRFLRQAVLLGLKSSLRLGCVWRQCRLQTKVCFWWPSSSCPTRLCRIPRAHQTPSGRGWTVQVGSPLCHCFQLFWLQGVCVRTTSRASFQSYPIMQLVSAPAGATRLEPRMLLTSCVCHWIYSVALGEMERGE